MSFLARWACATAFMSVLLLWIRYGIVKTLGILAVCGFFAFCGFVITLCTYARDPRER